MKTEILLAILQKVSQSAAVLVCLTFIILILAFVFYFVSMSRSFSEEERMNDSSLALVKISAVVLLIVSPFAAIPSVDDLWKVRIGLIKLQLASPENIQKGSEVIERIGKKLECKYLGCDEDVDQ